MLWCLNTENCCLSYVTKQVIHFQMKKRNKRERENLYSNNSIYFYYYYYYYYIIGLFKIFYYMIGYFVLILKFELIGENEDQSANPSGDTSLSVLLRRKFEVRRAEKD